MNERQALSEGLSFTGCYKRSYEKELVKAEAKRIRDLGFRAVVVEEVSSRYDRGGRRVGYSVYAEEKYFISKILKNLKSNIESFPARRQRAEEDFKKTMEGLEKEEKEFQEKIKELEEKLK